MRFFLGIVYLVFFPITQVYHSLLWEEDKIKWGCFFLKAWFLWFSFLTHKWINPSCWVKMSDTEGPTLFFTWFQQFPRIQQFKNFEGVLSWGCPLFYLVSTVFPVSTVSKLWGCVILKVLSFLPGFDSFAGFNGFKTTKRVRAKVSYTKGTVFFTWFQQFCRNVFVPLAFLYSYQCVSSCACWIKRESKYSQLSSQRRSDKTHYWCTCSFCWNCWNRQNCWNQVKKSAPSV